jgi:ubiquinone/menaquinone biosynthesis C-methylase UbiE
MLKRSECSDNSDLSEKYKYYEMSTSLLEVDFVSHDDKIKRTVRESYGKIWKTEGTCCTPSPASVKVKQVSEHSVHEALLHEIMPLEGKRILDVGCGNGSTVLKIAKQVSPGGKAVGIDFSKEGIAEAKKKAVELGLGKVTEFRVADAEKLPFKDSYFDVVISECVVCLTPNKQKVLAEKTRVLKPGGKIVMHDVISKAHMPKAVQTNSELYCSCIGGAVSQDEYVRMLQKAGLTEIKTVDYSEELALDNYPVSLKRALDSQILLAATDIEDEKDFQEVVNFVRNGGVGYTLFTAKKPQPTSLKHKEISREKANVK